MYIEFADTRSSSTFILSHLLNFQPYRTSSKASGEKKNANSSLPRPLFREEAQERISCAAELSLSLSPYCTEAEAAFGKSEVSSIRLYDDSGPRTRAMHITWARVAPGEIAAPALIIIDER